MATVPAWRFDTSVARLAGVLYLPAEGVRGRVGGRGWRCVGVWLVGLMRALGVVPTPHFPQFSTEHRPWQVVVRPWWLTCFVAVELTGVDAGEIARVSALVGDLARRDVSHLSQGDLLEAHDAVARLGRLTGTLQARFAGEIARRSTPDLPRGGLARQQGFGTAGAMVARATGGTTAGALRAIEAGLAFAPEPAFMPDTSLGDPTLGDPTHPATAQPTTAQPTSAVGPAPALRYPFVAEAALLGDLSVDAAGLITAGLETLAESLPSEQLHDLEQRLVGKAVHLAVHEVRRLVASAVARVDLPGHEERENRHYAERYLAWKEDHHGVITFSGRLDAVTAAPIRTVIEQMVTHDFRARRGQDSIYPDQRTLGQMRADALFQICRHALGCKQTDTSGIRTTIIVRMDKSDLDTGRGLGSIDGTGTPVSVGQLRRLAGDAGIIPAVLGGESETLDLGRTKRMFTPAQRLALLERDGGCAKCHAPPEHCEAHHIRWWERGGGTDLSNGVMLCTRCHHDVHRQGWEIKARAGAVEFIPPSTINPLRTPIPGGIAALEIDPRPTREPAPQQLTPVPGENSASGEHLALGDNSAQRDGSAYDVTWHQAA